MIVPMKKITLLAMAADEDAVLSGLRSLGVNVAHGRSTGGLLRPTPRANAFELCHTSLRFRYPKLAPNLH